MQTSESFNNTEEEKYFLASIVESSQDSIITFNFDGIITSWNKAAELLYGYSASETVGKPLSQLILPENHKEILINIDHIRHRRQVEVFEAKRIDKNGHQMLLEVTLSPVKNAKGKVIGISSIARKMQNMAHRQKRQQAEEALSRSEANLANAQRIAHIGSWDTDLQNNHLSWSDEIYRIFGRDKNQFGGTYEAFFDAIHPEDRQRVQLAAKAALSQIAPYNVVHRIIRPDGEERIVEEIGEVIFDESGNPLHFIGTVQDITERKLLENELAANKALLTKFVKHTPAAVAMLDMELRYLQVSEQWLTDYNLVGQNIIGKRHYEIFPDVPERWKAIHQRCLAGATEKCDEDPFPRADGTIDWLQWEVRPWQKPNGEIGGIIFFTQVITKRKAAEVEMRLMKSAIDSIVEGILITDAQKPDNPIIYVNSAFEKLTGYTFEEAKGQNYRMLQGAETNHQTVNQIREAIEQKTMFRGEILNYRKNGEPFWNKLSISSVFDKSGHLTNFVGIQQDISRRKQAEATLQASEAKFRQLVDSSIIGIITTNLNGSIIEANDVFLKTVGYSRSELLAGKLRWDEMTPPEILWEDELARKELTELGYSNPREKEYIRKNGSRVPVMVGGTLLKGTENSVIAFVLDISERKRAEAALRESEIRLRTIVETEPECVKILGLKGELLEMNSAGLAMIEADSIEQVRGVKVIKIVAPEYRRAFAKLTKNVLAGSTEILEFEAIGLKGTRRWLETHAVPMSNQAGEITSLLGVTRDMTERKRDEEEKAQLTAQMKHQHARLNNIVANVPGVVWEIWNEPDSATQRIDFVSEYVKTMVGYTVEEWLSTPRFWLSIIHPEDKERIVRETTGKLLKGEGYTIQFRWIAKDKRIVWVEMQATVIRDEAGQPIGLRGINIDITERRQLEEDRINLTAELAFEKARLQHIFDNSPSFIISLRGPEFVFEMANPAYYKLVGNRDLIGIPVQNALPEVVDQGFVELLKKVYNTGVPFIGNEIPVKLQLPVDKAEEQIYLNFIYTPLRESDGKISGVISYGINVTEQVLSRARIQESEERYRFLFDNNPLPMWVFDLNTLAFLSVNSAAIETYGYSQEEFLSMSLHDIRLPEDIPVYLESVKREIPGIRKVGVVRHRKKDGTIIYAEIISKQLIFAGRKAKLALANDVTERLKAEESIRFQAHLLDTVEQAVIATDLDGIVNYWNQFAQNLYGWTSDEAVGRNIQELTTPEISREQASGIMTQLRVGKGWAGKFVTQNKDSKSFPAYISYSPVTNNDGKLIGIVGISNDITESSRAEAALRQAEDKYRTLVESSPAIVYLVEPRPPYSAVYFSPNITRLGYTTEEWFNRPDMWSSLIHQEDRSRVLRATEDAIEQGNETDLEYRIVTGDGTTYWLHDKGRLVVDKQGNKTGWQGVMIDITKTKQLEEQLRQSQKLESVGLLAGGIAHDFNNMLTAINGYSDLTLRRLKADDPLRHSIEEIKKAGQRSADLTQQLLAFSRQQMMQPVLLDLNETIRDTIKMLERLIGEDIQLTTTLNPKVGRVNFDPGQFSQIIMNLAVNARDAMPQGGKLTIETANIFLEPEYVRRLVGVLPGAYVVLTVSDNGTGISRETKEHIFEPFFTTKEVGQGTGLGLATVYGIVKQSGGNIEVSSEEAVGTTFRIYLPQVAEQKVEEKLKYISTEMPCGTEIILLVEDEELVRNLSREILTECGYTVIEARNGLEALEICDKGNYQFDLLLTDVVMPEMSGRVLAEKLAAKLPNLKILFTSGYTDDAVVRHGIIETNTNFIQKPFTFDTLARKVRELLDAKGSNAEIWSVD